MPVISRSHSRARAAALIAAAALAALPASLLAATDNWTGASGSWTTAANWTTPPSTHNVPAAGDTVNVTSSDGVSRTITYNYAGAPITLGNLTIDLTGGSGGATETVTQFSEDITTGNQIIGNSGSGTFDQGQANNTLAGASNLTLGNNVGSSGTYLFDGGSFPSTLTVGGSAIVGNSGSGSLTFDQGKITAAITGSLSIGANASGSGTVFVDTFATVSAANIYVGGSASGPGGAGVLNIAFGSVTTSGGLTLYNTTGSALILSDQGTLSVGTLTISNPALLNWTGGTLHLTNQVLNFALTADPANAHPLGKNLTLAADMELDSDNWEWIFGNGASVTQNAGRNSTPILNIGNTTGSGPASPYTLNGGTLTVSNSESIGYIGIYGGTGGAGLFTQTGGTNSADFIIIGNNGPGTYNQSGGLTTVGSSVTLGGGNASGAGILNLSAGIFSATSIFIGGSSSGPLGSGIVNISGTGSLSVAQGNITIYNVPGNALNLNGGSLTALKINVSGNPALFHWTAGALHLNQGVQITDTSDLNVLFGNSLTLTSSQSLFITDREELKGNGSSIVQTGGSNTTSTIDVNNVASTGAPASYTFSGGLLAATLNVGYGNYTQSGGLLNAGDIFIGNDGNSNVTISSGVINVTFHEQIGLDSIAVVTQTGGSQTIGTELDIAQGILNGTSVTFNFSGGAITAPNIFLGGSLGFRGGAGVFTVSGSAALTTAGSLTIWNTPGTILNFSGGSITAASLNFDGAAPHFNWTAGALTLTTDVTWDSTADPSSTSSAMGAALTLATNQSLIITGSETLGGMGPFAMTLNAGSTHTVGNVLTLSGDGILTLSGGTLTTAKLDFTGTRANFIWNSGTLEITTTVTWDPSAANTTPAAFGSSLTLGSGQILVMDGNEFLGNIGSFTLTLNTGSSHVVDNLLTINPTGKLVLNGGSLSFVTLHQAGGAITGTLTVPSIATYNYSGGTFTGQLVNAGTANISSNFTSSNGLNNSGTLAIAAGVSATFNGAGVTNSGTIPLAGSTLIAASLLNNGVISGYGQLTTTAAFTNAAQIIQQGGNLTITSGGNIINNGDIELAASSTFTVSPLTSFTNNATVNLNNATLASAATIVNAAGGQIVGKGTLAPASFSNAGLLEVDSGLLKVTPAFSNSGQIRVQSDSSFSGGAITNSGAISGDGALANPVTNNGLMEEEGIFFLTGAVTNTSLGTLSVPDGGTLRLATGLTANAGLISLTGGTLDTLAATLTNGATGQITGYGTIRTGGITNNGLITLTGGTSTINGPVTNSSGKTINVQYQPALFTGNVTNLGTFNVTGTTVTFTGTYSGNAYHSDPATNIFENSVTINAAGSMTGQAGDKFIFTGGAFTNNGTFTNAGLLQSAINFTNNGTFTQSGPQTWSPNTTFTNTAGTAIFTTSPDAASAGHLSITVSGGTVHLASLDNLSTITLTGGTTTISGPATTASLPPSISVGASAILEFAASYDFTSPTAPSLTGSGTIIIDPADTLSLRVDSPFSGTIIANGTLYLAAALNPNAATFNFSVITNSTPSAPEPASLLLLALPAALLLRRRK